MSELTPRTYERRRSVTFRKTNEDFGGLSNMAPGYPIVVNGTRFLTSEALYQACRFPHRPDVQRLIASERSPMTAKMRSKPFRGDTRPDWDRMRTKVMRWCLQMKLAQNWDKFSALLLATDDQPIVEESTKDDFWGAIALEGDVLEGHNVLGRLLMELREDIRLGRRTAESAVPVPEIGDFLLFGAPIAFPGWHNTHPQHVPVATPPSAPEAPKVQEHSPTQHGATPIPRECKRLAEVDFPIAIVSKHAAREKYAGPGSPSTLHLWWARRPLASSRAMLMALLMPDPCDPRCPASFKRSARQLLAGVTGRIGPGDEELRVKLLRFVGEFANGDLAGNRTWLGVARDLVSAAHQEAPLVVDPFAGGGSIPLEALRLGCEAFASDVNPVAGLNLKVLLEDIPRRGTALAEDARRSGRQIQKVAEEGLAEFFPRDPDGARPIAYLWARTVRCESPNCGAEIPLVRSFWLAKKASRKRALRYAVDRPASGVPNLTFEVFEPRAEKDVPKGTVTRAKALCAICGSVVPPERVRSQLAGQRGGADAVLDSAGRRTGGARLLAVVSVHEGEAGRRYRAAEKRDYEAVHRAQREAERIADRRLDGGLLAIPDERLPPIGTLGFRVQRYGVTHWRDLFTARQKVTQVFFSEQVARTRAAGDVRNILGCAFDRVAMSNMSCTRWNASAEKMQHTFGRQALPIVWDFAEVVPTADAPGSWQSGYELAARVVDALPSFEHAGQVQVADATKHPLVSDSASIWFTDPPYYDAVPYADLSDFFFVWLKRVLPGHPVLRDPFDSANPLTPKREEAVQDETKRDGERVKDRAWFEEVMAKAFTEGRRVLKDDGIGSVVFAHKTTEGWEALLSGMVRGGWTITGSWPLATEMGSRLRARDSAALATSVHLVCRPRPDNAGTGDWGEILRALPSRVGDWMERLQAEGVRGADLVFACIGPALEVFSRYERVESADGTEIGLDTFLQKVWEVVGRSALEQVLGTAEAKARNGAAGALEEDARLTALFLWTLESTAVGDGDEPEDADDDEDDDAGGAKRGGYALVYDVVRRFAQPLGIHLEAWDGRIIEQVKGVVRLLGVRERARQLFGEAGADAVADALTRTRAPQLTLFPEEAPRVRGAKRRAGAAPAAEMKTPTEATTLDRVHAAMLLQSAGRTQALRALIVAEQQRGTDFERLANALSALYPRDSEEKRLLDAMLLAVPR